MAMEERATCNNANNKNTNAHNDWRPVRTYNIIDEFRPESLVVQGGKSRVLDLEPNKNLVWLLDRIVPRRYLDARNGALSLFVCVFLQRTGLTPGLFNQFLDAFVE
jgi:hypothetical protein